MQTEAPFSFFFHFRGALQLPTQVRAAVVALGPFLNVPPPLDLLHGTGTEAADLVASDGARELEGRRVAHRLSGRGDADWNATRWMEKHMIHIRTP